VDFDVRKQLLVVDYKKTKDAPPRRGRTGTAIKITIIISIPCEK
jgi:hypothetical protein